MAFLSLDELCYVFITFDPPTSIVYRDIRYCTYGLANSRKRAVDRLGYVMKYGE